MVQLESEIEIQLEMNNMYWGIEIQMLLELLGDIHEYGDEDRVNIGDRYIGDV